MEIKNGVWSEEEVKTLFKFVEVKKSEGVALINIFKLFAEKVGRMQNSVRNYYYKEVERLSQDKKRCEALSINISEHKVLNIEPFSLEDEKKLKMQVEELIGKGYSVRKACLVLADGDATKMIRIQNKYRSLIEKNKNEVTNVIKMPLKRNILNDEDVNALFLGLIKLVKKQQYEKAKIIYENDLESANAKLKTAIEGIVQKENEIDKLQKQIKILQNQAKTLKQKFEEYKSENKEKSAKNILSNYFFKGETIEKTNQM